MKKVSIMFPLVLALSFVSCSQAETGDGKQQTEDKKTIGLNPRQTGASQEVSDEEMTEEEKKARAKQLAVETAEAFKVLKDKRDEYEKKMTDAKKTYEEQDASLRDGLRLPNEVKKFTADEDKIYASLGYDNETIENLDKLIGFLQLGDSTQSKTVEKKMVSDILTSLVSLEDTTKKIMDDHLKEDNLRKIENNKVKIDTANKELDGFIASRTAFVEDIKKTIKEAKKKSESSSEAEVKVELKKIADTEPATDKPDEAGYFHTKLEATKKNAIALDNLMK
ncbi:hypothetical protein [Borrelia sp. RT1S]|uniref:hypothetical protein n=1 Tax=Borrelia sp. RT1S TaxID=2898580 RepID=UPI001E374919|nr:hypothetical protein [Borrelia sp. RT1S]UGQ17973.1 hypothetical protein LSO05_05935 [Borrelia sp. RT1S]